MKMVLPSARISVTVVPHPAALRSECALPVGPLDQSLLASDRFFELASNSIPDARLYYACVYSESVPVAVALVTESTQRLAGVTLRVALCGNPFVSSDSAIIPLGPDALSPGVIKGLSDALFERGIQGIVLKETAAPEETLTRAGYFKLPLEPAFGVPIDGWQTFSHYRTSLTSHYRALLTRASRELQKRGIVASSEKRVDAIADDLYLLYANVAHADPPTRNARPIPLADRIATALTHLPRRFVRLLRKDFFVGLRTLFPRESDIITLRAPDGEVIASTANLQVGDVFYSVYVGMHPSRPETPFVYRHLLALKLQHAIERDSRLMQLGRTGAKTKAELGAVVMPESVYCKLRLRPLHFLLARAAAGVRVRQSAFHPRSVFREQRAA